MAHYQQLKFIEIIREKMDSTVFNDGRILEIGSYGVNGTIRQYFPQKNYIGVDLTEGPNVDVVGSGHEVDFENDSFNLCISCEVFEHNPYWKETLKNMYRMTKNNGYVCITVASRGRLEHGTTRTDPMSSPGTTAVNWDYYKNIFKSELLNEAKKYNFSDIYCKYNSVTKDLYFFARKTKESRWNFIDVNNKELDEIFIRKENKSFKGKLFGGLLTIISFIFNDEVYQNLALKLIKVRDEINLKLK
ncbi:methyltransferase domain-containing protein [Aliivibrio fischeri]|uniref:class I SAM-dependent methyltransferase n=1 Tax=Aliivibrio fischeri TaxID=668 RepID=UPI0012DA53E1|nr:class I SAM-dependent methyltransferase [Aliivibrio fischeri]MUJ26415.1 methyltransferase domain-containing protein [Aliivibrio fischeri]